jgi:hypothetical protein
MHLYLQRAVLIVCFQLELCGTKSDGENFRIRFTPNKALLLIFYFRRSSFTHGMAAIVVALSNLGNLRREGQFSLL